MTDFDQLTPTADISPGTVTVTWASKNGIDLLESHGNVQPQFDGLRVMFDRPEFGPAFEIPAAALDEVIDTLCELRTVRDLVASRTFQPPSE